MLGLGNAGFLKFTIDPQPIRWSEKEQIRQIDDFSRPSAVPGLIDFNNPAVLLALWSCDYHFSLLSKVKGRIILSILATFVLGILIHVVDISKIDFASNHLGAPLMI